MKETVIDDPDPLGRIESRQKRTRTLSIMTLSSVLVSSVTLSGCSTTDSTNMSASQRPTSIASSTKVPGMRKGKLRKKGDKEEEEQTTGSSYHSTTHVGSHGGGWRWGWNWGSPSSTTSTSRTSYTSSPRISAPSRGFFGWGGGMHFSGFGG